MPLPSVSRATQQRADVRLGLFYITVVCLMLFLYVQEMGNNKQEKLKLGISQTGTNNIF